MKHNPTRFVLNGVNITPADLKANRAGYLSERQAVALRRKRNRRLFMFRYSATTAFLMTFLIALPAFYANTTIERTLYCLVPLIALSVGIVFLRRIMQFRARINRDLRHGRVEMSEGYALLEARSHADHQVSIDDLTFRVSADEFRSFRDYQMYRVYYTPAAWMIVAAEHIPA
jgi:hypothetical protein